MGTCCERILWQARKQKSSGGGHRRDAAGIFVILDLSSINILIVSCYSGAVATLTNAFSRKGFQHL